MCEWKLEVRCLGQLGWSGSRALATHFRAGGIPVRSCQGRGAGEACAGARVNSLGIAGVGLGGELGSVEGIAHMSFGREASQVYRLFIGVLLYRLEVKLQK